jgi:predicted nucleotidyltransferase
MFGEKIYCLSQNETLSGIITSMQAELIKNIQGWCAQRPLQLCVLFGSQATGKAHGRSDVDLAIWPIQPFPPRRKLTWLLELEMLLNKSVSLIIVSPDLNPVLGFEIVRDGRLLYEHQTGAWDKVRRQLWHAYNDSLPFRRAAREQLRQFAEEVRRGT